MAFDEDFHFGLIKLYSQHWLPFITHQPPDANVFGPVANNPSYLYHYLMSFPYRFITLFTHDQTLQVIWLRLINVTLFGYALVLFRRVLIRAKLSPAFTNLSLLLFILLPIVPMLAGEINYDNLTIVLVAWACLLTERILPVIHRRKIPLCDISLLAILVLLGCIVKYAFLPVLAACAIVIAAYAWKSFGHDFRAIWRANQKAFNMLSVKTRTLLTVLILISIGMFSQRYLVNLAAYKTPIPRCDKVLTVDDCMSYGPFNRTYVLMQTKNPDFKATIPAYLPQWFYGMWFRTFFAVNGNIPNPYWARYETIPPLVLPSAIAVFLIIASIALVAVNFRKLRHDWLLIFMGLMAALYAAALFIDNFGAYARSSQPVAINGRYLLPIVLPLVIIAGRAWQITLDGRSPRFKLAITGIVLLLFIQGGGVLTFMIESNYAWYWPDHRVQTASYYAAQAARKIVIDDQPMYILSP